MPTPSAKESKPEFITRCMAYPDMQEYDTEKRYAICQSKWSEAKMAKIKDLNIDIHYDNNPDVVKALGPIGKLFNA